MGSVTRNVLIWVWHELEFSMDMCTGLNGYNSESH